MSRRRIRSLVAFFSCLSVVIVGAQSCGVDVPPVNNTGGNQSGGHGGAGGNGGEGAIGGSGGSGGSGAKDGGNDADANTCATPCHLSADPNADPDCCAEAEQCCDAATYGYAAGDLCRPAGESCPVACPGGVQNCPVDQYCLLDPTLNTYTCEDACDPDSTCGSNLCCPIGSACKAGACPLPDLSIDAVKAKNSAHVIQQNFAPNSCEEQEGCINAPGQRTLLYFDTKTPNTGAGDLVLGDPTGNPLFEFSQCHQHYHFKSYANYRLLDTSGNEVATGHKQAFCLEDLAKVNPNAGPGNHTCQNQGITRGWADIYSGGLPCQWIDITDVPSGDYQVEVVLNSEHILAESDYSNNLALFDVNIPTNSCPHGCVNASETCCAPGDPCGWAANGSCDCGGYFSWDSVDCSDCHSQANACKPNTCPGGCTPNTGACCVDGDPCGLADNGVCDCGGTTTWDTADCGNCHTPDADCPAPPPECLGCQGLSPLNPHCAINDPDGWADDGWCDCPGVPWDDADCAVCDAQGCPP